MGVVRSRHALYLSLSIALSGSACSQDASPPRDVDDAEDAEATHEEDAAASGEHDAEAHDAGARDAAEAGAPEDAGESPRYETEIAPLFRDHCVLCHVTGGAGPFALTEYEPAYQYRREIRDKTAVREMPPCAESSTSCGLSNAQIALIGRWVQAGAPR